MKYDAILFDLDGTLWNSTAAVAESWKIALADEPDVDRPPTIAELESVMGMTAKPLMAALFPQLSEERGAELFRKCCEVENTYLREHGGVLYPEMENVLRTLAEKLPLGIISNCNAKYIPCFLDAHKLHDCFADWECIGRTGLEKWENIRLVAERNGFRAPIYVGDTVLDKAAADRAGVPFLHAAYGFGSVPGAERIEMPRDLLKLLD